MNFDFGILDFGKSPKWYRKKLAWLYYKNFTISQTIEPDANYESRSRLYKRHSNSCEEINYGNHSYNSPYVTAWRNNDCIFSGKKGIFVNVIKYDINTWIKHFLYHLNIRRICGNGQHKNLLSFRSSKNFFFALLHLQRVYFLFQSLLIPPMTLDRQQGEAPILPIDYDLRTLLDAL